jgi:membrane-bound lytic murein transglycosylase A
MEKISVHETRIGRKQNGRTVPYYTRREIDVDGVLAGKGLELIWVADPVELFSLHIQGSGKIRLEDGTMLSVSYAQNNGRPFRSATVNMLDQNRIDRGDSSYRGFKAWLKGKSENELYDILSHNERYIFFRFVDREPVGSLGQPVTPDRTIATDPAYFPEGALAFIRLRKPVLDKDFNVVRRIEFSRFVLNQDKGSAIKGPGRVDLFCGFGSQAQAAAGSLKEKGELYFLLLK